MELKVLINCFREQIRYNVKIPYWEFISNNMLPVEYSDTQLKTNHMFNIAHGSAPEQGRKSWGDGGDISPPCFDMGGMTCLLSPPCFDPQICCFFVLEN